MECDYGIKWFDWCGCFVGLGDIYVGLWIDCMLWVGLCINFSGGIIGFVDGEEIIKMC